MEDNQDLQNTDAPNASKDALLQRRDDHLFMTELDELVRYGEDKRLSYMKSYEMRGNITHAITILSVISGAAGFAWFFLMVMDIKMALASIGAGIALPIALSPWKTMAIKAYKKHHKESFMPRLAQAIGGLKYFQHRGIGHKIILKSGVTAPYKTYEAEDCFMGVYKGVKVIMSEARLYKDEKKTTPVFDGIFALLEVPAKIFKGHTIITADQNLVQHYAHTRWSGLQPITPPGGDDAPYKGRFQVYTNNAENAMKHLNEQILTELVEIADIFDESAISTVFMGKKFIFMAIPYEEDMFEASNMFIPVTMQSYIKKCKSEIEKILEIIDIFEMYNKKKKEPVSPETSPEASEEPKEPPPTPPETPPAA